MRFGRVRFYVRRVSGNHQYQSCNNSIMDKSHSSAVTEKKNSIIFSNKDSNEDSDENDYGDVSNNNITMNPALSNKRHSLNPQSNRMSQGNQILTELRKSYDSSLMFESQNEHTLNKIMEKKESFTQIQTKRNSILYNPNKES